MTGSTSTNTLGFVLWTVALTVVLWLAGVSTTWWKLRKKSETNAFLDALKESLTSGVFSAVSVVALVLIVWAGFTVRTVFNDHQSLVERNRELLGRGNGNPHMIFANNQYASTINTFQAFTLLRDGDNTIPTTNNPCHLLITYPEENKLVGQILSSLATAAHCFVEGPDPLMILPSPPSNIVIVHVSPSRKNGAAFATGLTNVVQAKISPDEPKTPNVIWIEVGKGNVWRKDY